MKFEFTDTDLKDAQSLDVLKYIVKVYDTAPIAIGSDIHPSVTAFRRNFDATGTTVGELVKTSVADGIRNTGLQSIAAVDPTLILQNIVYDEHGPSCPGAISSEVLLTSGSTILVGDEPVVAESTTTETPAVKPKGRPRKSVAAQAAELVEALKTPVEPTPLEKAIADVVKESAGVISVEVVQVTVAESEPVSSMEEFDLMSLASSPTTTVIEIPPEPSEHQALVNAVRDLMYDRGHVWMRNVLEKYKKVAKSTAEFPDEVLQAILANPDSFNELV